MKQSNKKVMEEKIGEEIKQFKGMFDLWRKHDDLGGACEWLVCHVARLKVRLDEVEKKLK